MKKLQSTLLLCVVLSLAGCQSATEPENSTPTERSQNGPWNGSIYAATSTDGLTFTGRTLVQDRAGVPNLLKLKDGTLVLSYQYFSETDTDLFDVIVYSTSTDNGETWSQMVPYDIEDLPTAPEPSKKPMDPTLVQLEDGRLRLYFTYHAQGNKTAGLYEATSQSTDLSSAFVTDSTPSLLVDDANLLDPSVTYFNGLWHHYSWQENSDKNYHSTSADGITFTRQDDIALPMDFLGEVIPFGEGLRFYGTGDGIVTAYSDDGYTWSVDQSKLAQGADPAVQELDDGSYLMIYTSLNFN